MDGVGALNEVLHLAKVSKRECFLCKVDFKKAYDSSSWSFLDEMLQRYGFDVRWRAWT